MQAEALMSKCTDVWNLLKKKSELINEGTRKLDVLNSMGLQRVRHSLATEQHSPLAFNLNIFRDWLFLLFVINAYSDIVSNFLVMSYFDDCFVEVFNICWNPILFSSSVIYNENIFSRFLACVFTFCEQCTFIYRISFFFFYGLLCVCALLKNCF